MPRRGIESHPRYLKPPEMVVFTLNIVRNKIGTYNPKVVGLDPPVAILLFTERHVIPQLSVIILLLIFLLDSSYSHRFPFLLESQEMVWCL